MTTTNGTGAKTKNGGLTWDDLFLAGVVIDLTASLWRARLRIRPVDLGIENTKAVDEALALGVTRLAPKAAFEKIDAAVHAANSAIADKTIAFGFIHGARYVPRKNLSTLVGRLTECRRDFDAAVEVFIAEYEQVKAAQLPVIEQALVDAAKTPEAAAAALDRIRSEYPPAESLRDLFALRWAVYAIEGAKVEGATDIVGDESAAVRDVVRDMVTGLRNEVAEKLAGVLALINRGGKLQPRSIDAAMEVLDHVDSVNVLGDEALTAQVDAIRKALRGITPGKRVSDAEVASLEGLSKALAADVEAAVAAAEQNLTAVGRRKVAATVAPRVEA